MSVSRVRPRHLRNRLMAAFAVFTLIMAALFGLYTLVFMYSVEDSFFDAQLEQEANRQLRAYAANGEWIQPVQPFIRVYTDPAQFPDEWRATFLAEPQRHEFPGDEGRHYHLRTLATDDIDTTAWLVAEVSRQLVVRPIRGQVLWLLAGTALLAVLLALLLGSWLARRTTASLSRLAAAVDTMAPDRMPRGLAQGFGQDEVAVVARGLDALITRIHDFVEREKTFTRDASHELRTPLAVIGSAAERLADDPALSADSRRFLRSIEQSVQQMESTVTLLLTLAREEQSASLASAHGLDTPASTPVLPLLERAIVDNFAAGGDDDVPLRLAVPPDAMLPMPSAALTIVLNNLVGNALRHRHGDGIDITWHDGWLQVANRVAGSTPNIDRSLRDAFGKRDDSPGWGLGLTIIQRVCARHGIDVRLERDGECLIASIGAG